MFSIQRVPKFRKHPALSTRLNEMIDAYEASRPVPSVGTKMVFTALGTVRQATPAVESETGDEPVWY